MLTAYSSNWFFTYCDNKTIHVYLWSYCQKGDYLW